MFPLHQSPSSSLIRQAICPWTSRQFALVNTTVLIQARFTLDVAPLCKSSGTVVIHELTQDASCTEKHYATRCVQVALSLAMHRLAATNDAH